MKKHYFKISSRDKQIWDLDEVMPEEKVDLWAGNPPWISVKPKGSQVIDMTRPDIRKRMEKLNGEEEKENTKKEDKVIKMPKPSKGKGGKKKKKQAHYLQQIAFFGEERAKQKEIEKVKGDENLDHWSKTQKIVGLGENDKRLEKYLKNPFSEGYILIDSTFNNDPQDLEIRVDYSSMNNKGHNEYPPNAFSTTTYWYSPSRKFASMILDYLGGDRGKKSIDETYVYETTGDEKAIVGENYEKLDKLYEALEKNVEGKIFLVENEEDLRRQINEGIDKSFNEAY